LHTQTALIEAYVFTFPQMEVAKHPNRNSPCNDPKAAEEILQLIER